MPSFVLGTTIIVRLQLILLQIVCSHVVILYFFCLVLRVTVYRNLTTVNITLKLKKVKKTCMSHGDHGNHQKLSIKHFVRTFILVSLKEG